MNPEEKPPSSKTPSKAWRKHVLCAYFNSTHVALKNTLYIARMLALILRNKYIFEGIDSGVGVDGNYFGMIAVTLIISDDIKYRVVDRL